MTIIKTNINNNKDAVKISKKDGCITITFLDDIDAYTVSEFKDNIKSEVNNSGKSDILMDISKVEFIDSHAVGLFVSLLKIAHKNNCKMIFIGANGQPKSILNIVGLNDDVVSFVKTIDDI